MRATGSTVAGGPREAVTVDLPREERISREGARARIAAGAARRKVEHTSPFAAARAAEAADPERAAAVKAVAPAAPARPKPTPAPVSTRSATDLLAARRVDVAGIVQDYVGGDTVLQIAERRGHSTTTVRRVLRDTPGLTLRNEAAEAGPRNAGRRTASMELRDEIAAVGLTVTALRQWAREHDVPVSGRGAVGRSVLDAYLEATTAAPEPAPQPTSATPRPDELDVPDLSGFAAAGDRADSIPTPNRSVPPDTAPVGATAPALARDYVPYALANLDRATSLAKPLRDLGRLLAGLGQTAADLATTLEALSHAAREARDLAYPPDTPAEQAARRRALAAESRRRTR